LVILNNDNRGHTVVFQAINYDHQQTQLYLLCCYVTVY